MREHVSGRRRVAAGLATVAVSAIGLVGAFPSAAGASTAGGGGDHDRPPFGPDCPDGGWYFHWGPEDQAHVPGAHDQDDDFLEAGGEGEFSVEISEIRSVDGQSTIDYTTSVPVTVVFAQGRPDTQGTTQEHDPAVTEGTISVEDPEYVKYVAFCTPDTPPPTEPTTTTTEAPTTTTTESTTTTEPEPTTTTTAPPSTETTLPPSTEAPTTAPPTTEPVSDEELPRTGSTTMPIVAGAGALLAVGVALVAGKRFMQQRA